MSEVKQEEDRLPSRAIVVTLVAGLLFMGGGVLTAALLARGWQGALRPGGGQPARASREIGIVDQTPIERDHFGLRLRAAQERRLSRYGWADRGAGVATIPIERAMEMLLARPELVAGEGAVGAAGSGSGSGSGSTVPAGGGGAVPAGGARDAAGGAR